ncbi:hypothetical protein Tco_1418572 [Tanacetum coccineum]
MEKEVSKKGKQRQEKRKKFRRRILEKKKDGEKRKNWREKMKERKKVGRWRKENKREEWGMRRRKKKVGKSVKKEGEDLVVE